MSGTTSNVTDFTLGTSKNREFTLIDKSERWNDGLFLFFQNIFHLYPEAEYHNLVKSKVRDCNSDKAVYEAILADLPKIKPFLQDFTYALPALKVQKEEMTRQALLLLDGKINIDGYLEIGSPGRYISHLRQFLSLTGELVLINDTAPGYGPADIIERGGLKKIGRFVPLNNYDAPSAESLPAASFDLATCHIGLHHAPLSKLKPFLNSVVRALRPSGRFILRDHDAGDPDMHTFASLVHSVFNAGLGISWEVNAAEVRNFRALDHWRSLLSESGLDPGKDTLFQANDPSLNALMIFRKR